jgi:hypothetical protein
MYNDVIIEEDRTRVFIEVQKALAEDRSFILKYRIVTASGEIKKVWEQGSAITLLDGRLVLEGFITSLIE